jgi:prevent-host-death family protein
MTRTSAEDRGQSTTPDGVRGGWPLQDAKARFSELVRYARSHGPQHVTVHGRASVVVLAVEEFNRLQGAATGRSLVDVLQSSPHPEISIDVPRATMPVRDVEL